MLDTPGYPSSVQHNWTYFFGYLPGVPEQADH